MMMPAMVDMVRRRAVLRALGTLTLALSLAGVADAKTLSADLRTHTSIRFLGGNHVAGVGDVNGDGNDDVAIGDCSANGRSGRVHVVFGPFASPTVDLSQPYSGFQINGTPATADDVDPESACHVERGGDVNGDGLADLLVSVHNATSKEQTNAGAVYVVFGRSSDEAVALKDFDDNTHGDRGYRIGGAYNRSFAGSSVSSLGDLNSDGRDDLAMTAPFDGSTYVVFGKADPAPLDLLAFELAAQGPLGYRIDTPVPSHLELNVAGAGDVNGDGTPDVVIGLNRYSFGHGVAFVVFGKSNTSSVDVNEMGEGGYKIIGTYASRTGRSVDGLGDVNGDGLSDIVVGAPDAVIGAGSAWVIFGKRDNERIHLDAPGAQGYRLIERPRVSPADHTGEDVSAAGDVNGDGRPDALVGAAYDDYRRRPQSGATYVLYGRSRHGRIRTNDMGGNGFKIGGPRRSTYLGSSLDSAGDLNGDGIDDVLVGGLRNVAFAVFGSE